MIPVTCDCGWEGTPERTEARAAWKLRRHQSGTLCPLPAPPPAYRCADCGERDTTTTPRGRCGDCQADHDRESPLDLSGLGRWVGKGGIVVWVEGAA